MADAIRSMLVPGLSGGIVLLILTFITDTLTQVVAPYSIFDVPGMREMTDPIIILYFLYPFIFSFIAAGVWMIIRGSFPSDPMQGGLWFGGILFLLVVVPNMWVVFTSMEYPVGFYISNLLCGLIGYPVIGYLNARYAH